MIPTLIAAMAFSILLAGSSSVAATQVMAAEDNSGYAMVMADDNASDTIATGKWGSCDWNVSSDGVLTIGGGVGASDYYYYDGSVWHEYDIYRIDIVGDISFEKNTSLEMLFACMEKVKEINGLDRLNTENVVNMSGMFEHCYELTSIDVSHFNTSNVTNMSCMFNWCDKLTYVDVSGFDTSKVTNMEEMFINCMKLPSIDVSGFDTSNVTDMSMMFRSCYALTSLDVSGFDTSNVTDMNQMFSGCELIKKLDIHNFNLSNINEESNYIDGMEWIFMGCDSISEYIMPYNLGTDINREKNIMYMLMYMADCQWKDVTDGIIYDGKPDTLMENHIYIKYVEGARNGLCQGDDGNWYYYLNDEIDTTYIGLACNEYGWFYVNNGVVDWSYTGLANNEYGWFYVNKGVLDWGYTGLANNEYGWFYVNNGVVDWSYTGLANNESGWFYVNKGVIDCGYTGLANNESGWFYVNNGIIDWNYTGTVSNEYGTWNVINGQVVF